MTLAATLQISTAVDSSSASSYTFDETTALSNIKSNIDTYKTYLEVVTPSTTTLTVDTAKITSSSTTSLSSSSAAGSLKMGFVYISCFVLAAAWF